MALSQQVDESLNEAQSARNERPVICNAISEAICRIEQIQTFDGLMDKLEEHYPGKQ
jgi:hypothetical protein